MKIVIVYNTCTWQSTQVALVEYKIHASTRKIHASRSTCTFHHRPPSGIVDHHENQAHFIGLMQQTWHSKSARFRPLRQNRNNLCPTTQIQLVDQSKQINKVENALHLINKSNTNQTIIKYNVSRYISRFQHHFFCFQPSPKILRQSCAQNKRAHKKCLVFTLKQIL